MAIVDDRTPKKNLPLPSASNALADDVVRLRQALTTLDTLLGAVDTALAAKAPLLSPALTGTPTAPTAAAGTNSTQIATTAYVRAAIAALVDSSPGALDTLNELAAALGDDPNFATTVMNLLAGKAASNLSNVASSDVVGKVVTLQESDPLPTDDYSSGFVTGSRITNTATKSEFVCTNSAQGAATWIKLRGGSGGSNPSTCFYL